MMKFSPEKQYKPIITVTVILLICAMIAVVYINIDLNFGFWYRFPSYIIAPVCMLSGLFIATRYITLSYEYALYGENDYPKDRFTVYKYIWDRKYTECSIDTANIKAVLGEKEFAEYKKSLKGLKKKIKKKRNYCSNLFVYQPCYIIYEGNGNLYAFKAEMCEELENAVREKIA